MFSQRFKFRLSFARLGTEMNFYLKKENFQKNSKNSAGRIFLVGNIKRSELMFSSN